MKTQILSAFTKKGFTLIELLIVIAIIGVITSIILGSLVMARTNARQKAITAEARQMVPLMARQYADAGTYDPLQETGWIGSGATTCAGRGFTGTYAPALLELCNSIATKLGNVNFQMYIGNSVSNVNNFSIMVKLVPQDGTTGLQFFCVGSSGRTYQGTYNSAAPGCVANP